MRARFPLWIALTGVAAPVVAQDRIAITSTTVIDGWTGRASDGQTIVIEGTRIVAVGPAGRVRIPARARVITGAGKWVTPGFIDVHTHSAPPSVLQRALAFGVTTIHMMPSVPVAADSLRRLEVWSNLPASPTPRLYTTSPLFTGNFPGNVLRRATNFVSPRDSVEVREILTKLRGDGFTSIKVIQDDGLLWTSSEALVPRLSNDVFQALTTHAHRLGMRVYAHVTQLVDAERAVTARTNVLVHGVMDTILPEGFWKRMREQRMVWAPALRIVAAGADRPAYARRILGDSFLKQSLTQTELDVYNADLVRTGPPADDPFPGLVPNGSRYIRVLQQNTRQARLHELTVAVGSDSGASGNGPGIGTHLEMELLQEAGLSPAEIIVAATFGGASALAVEAETGTVAAGKVADLLILNRNPLLDIRNARAIEWVIKGGRAIRPSQLLQPATGN